MEFSHVVFDDRRLPGDGCSHRYPIQGTERQGEGYRLSRACGKEAYLLQSEEFSAGGRAGFYILQRRLHGGERIGQGQRRERHKASGKIPQEGYLPSVSWYAPFGKSQGAEAAWPFPGSGLRHDAERCVEVGRGSTGFPAGGNEIHGREHMRVFP